VSVSTEFIMTGLFVFALAGFLGFEMIRRVPRLLHTPLMALTNALSAISLVGSIVVLGGQYSTYSTILGFVAVMLLANKLLGPKPAMTAMKQEPFECGATPVEQELRLKGVQVSSGGVRGVWQRHGLLTKHERLLRLERESGARQIALSTDQIRLLERFSPEFRERHIEAPHTGALVAVDTFFVGVLKGVGKIYLQTAIDCHSRYGWARLHT
jgi:hypothetical protein